MNHFIHTLTVDDEHNLMWSFASLMRPGLTKDWLDKSRSGSNGLSLTPLSFVELPVSIAAILRGQTLREMFTELARARGRIEPDTAATAIQFADEILSRSLVPLWGEYRYQWSKVRSHVELYSLAELISESSLYHYEGKFEYGLEYSPTQMFWAEHEGTSFLFINHPRAVIWGGSGQPYQLFKIWKTFIDWLYN